MIATFKSTIPFIIAHIIVIISIYFVVKGV